MNCIPVHAGPYGFECSRCGRALPVRALMAIRASVCVPPGAASAEVTDARPCPATPPKESP